MQSARALFSILILTTPFLVRGVPFLMLLRQLNGRLPSSARNSITALLRTSSHINSKRLCPRVDLMQLSSELSSIRQMQGTDYYFVAINFYNNEDILPDFILQFLQVVHVIGPSNMFVSVYENGSSDQTKSLLQLFRVLLDSNGVTSRVIFGAEVGGIPYNVHRIDHLSEVRNKVLEPLRKGETARRASKIVFMNDITYCASDIIDLLVQAELQSSDITCGAV